MPVGRTSPFHQIDVGLKAAPVLADLDRDGDLDLIVGESKGKLFYFQNKGSARQPEFDQAGDMSLFSGGIATGAADLDYIPALADLDGDGPQRRPSRKFAHMTVLYHRRPRHRRR